MSNKLKGASPEQEVLKDAAGHDEPGAAAHGEGLQGQVGAQHVCGPLGVCSRTSTTAAADNRTSLLLYQHSASG